MADKILVKRGLKANLPTLSVGEPAYCIDTKEFFVGTAEGNVLVNDLSQMTGKVDKVTGKGLSTNDYDNVEKAEVAKVKDKADKTYVDTELGKKATQSALDTTNANVAANTSALADKATKAEVTAVDTKITNIGNASPKGTYATLADLHTAFPTGTNGVYVVTADGKWYYWNGSAWASGGTYQATGIADKSVDANKLSFTKPGKNLFNKATAIAGYYIYDVDGKLYVNASYYASDYVEIEPSTSYVRNLGATASRYAWYDVNKTYISGGNAGATITSPANAKYIRFSVDNTLINTYQFEKGTSSTVYEDFHFSLVNITATPESNTVGTDKLIDKSVTIPKAAFLTIGKNLFNKDTVTVGKYVNNTNGNLDVNASYNASDYIEISSNTAYVGNFNYHIAFYDVNKTFISGLANGHSESYTTPSNAKYMRCSIPPSYLDSFQVELGTVKTEYQPFGYLISKGLYQLQSNATNFPVKINLPSKIFALVGQELNLYFDNIVNVKDIEYDFDVVATVGQQFEQFYRFTPSSSGSYPITINVLKNGSQVATASSTIVVSGASVGTGVNKKVIIIGDSTTDNGYPSIKLNANFNSDPMDISLIGTRGTAPDVHEGRSGWKAQHYVENASVSGVTNAFWNPNTSAFDFSYYMSSTGFAIPDYVVINLGINDTFNYSDDATLNAEIPNIINRYNTMINSIKAYNANIKIGIAITIPPNYSQDAFARTQFAGQNRARYKRNNFLFVQQLITTFQGREAENLYLVPIHLNLDTRYGFGMETIQRNARDTSTMAITVSNGYVHPGVTGYWQIADTYWYWLKSFEV